METTLYIVIIFFCVFIEAFFSGSEIAVISMDKIRLKHMLRKGASGANLLNKAVKRPEWLLGTTLVGTNLSVALSTTLATYLVIKWLGVKYEYLTILIMSPLLLIFAEILPKTVFQQRAGEIAPKIIYPLKIAQIVLSPFVFLTSMISGFISYILGKEEKERDYFVTKDELELLLKMSDAKAGGMKITQKRMIHRIFDFSETSVAEVMIPSINLKGLEINESLETVVPKLMQWKHSRVPVYKERIDNIIGVVNTFDFVIPYRRKTLKAYVRPIQYFPENAPIDDIMLKLQREGEGMAAVVDEYGGVAGVVALEDIIEEIVGEIEDEYDHTPEVYKKVSDAEYVVNAQMSIDALKEELGISFPKGEWETIAGFILERLKKIPKKGEICKYKNIRIEITKSSPRAIEEVRLLIDNEQ